MIRNYAKKIEEEQRKIVDYQHKIADIKNAVEKLILSD